MTFEIFVDISCRVLRILYRVIRNFEKVHFSLHMHTKERERNIIRTPYLTVQSNITSTQIAYGLNDSTNELSYTLSLEPNLSESISLLGSNWLVAG